jgi:benzoyl-CoA reductase subunit C
MEAVEGLQSLRLDPFQVLEQHVDSGTKVVGYTCSYVPEEIIISAGFQPFRVPDIDSPDELGNADLMPSFVCQSCSSVLRNILRSEEYFDGFVIAHTCDPMWRAYDILKKKLAKPVFLLRIPHDTANESALRFFKQELSRLRNFCQTEFGAKIDDDSLGQAIDVCNENRSLLKGIYLSNAQGRHSIDSVDRLQITLASMWMPKSRCNAVLRALDSDTRKHDEEIRLHMSGTTLYDLSIVRTIEDQRGYVASDDLCTGSRYFWENVVKSEDLDSALAQRYLRKTPCPCNAPLQDRLEYIETMIKTFNVQGLITLTNRFCDPMLFDYVHIKSLLLRLGIPLLTLDYENVAREINRLKVRVEAFLEALGD